MSQNIISSFKRVESNLAYKTLWSETSCILLSSVVCLDLHKFEQGIQHHTAQGSCTVTYTLPDGGSSIPYYVPEAVVPP